VLIGGDADTCASTLEIAFSTLDDLEVVTSGDGDQGLAAARDRLDGVAAIVTDLEMRGIDGFELMSGCAAMTFIRRVPSSWITGSSDPELRSGAAARRGRVFIKTVFCLFECDETGAVVEK